MKFAELIEEKLKTGETSYEVTAHTLEIGPENSRAIAKALTKVKKGNADFWQEIIEFTKTHER